MHSLRLLSAFAGLKQRFSNRWGASASLFWYWYMKNDPTFNNAMAGLYRTAVAVSALILSSSLAQAADPPVPRGNVSVNISPTTGYYVTNNTTVRLPHGVSTTPSAGASTVTKYSGGLKQSIPTGITINAVKKSAPLPVTVRASTPSLKGAAKGLLRANLAGLALGAGLQQLLNGVEWVMGEGGRIVKITEIPPDDLVGPWCDNSLGCGFSSPQVAADAQLSRHCPQREFCPYEAVRVNDYNYDYVGSNGSIIGKASRSVDSSCPDGYVFNSKHSCVMTQYLPVSQSDLDDAVDNSYIPDPTDWKNLVPHLTPDDIEITWAPSLQGEPKTTTEYDADGNPHKIRETNIWYDFDIRDNPSPQPKIDLKEREETKTFEDGVLTGTTTTESTASAGSDDTSQPPPESPIDCDLFPTACAWFEWTKEEPVEPDDDLSGLLQEVPIVSETYTITGGVAACPAPLVLDLSVFGSREVSYQPLCDLASTMKFLYLALMSFAAAVLLNRSINRV